jgi:hypothetical protein
MWSMPADGTQDERIVSDLDRHIPLALKVARGGKFDPKIQLVWLADGPNFTSPTPPRDQSSLPRTIKIHRLSSSPISRATTIRTICSR